MKTIFKLTLCCLLMISLSYAQENSLAVVMRQNQMKIQELIDSPTGSMQVVMGNQSADMDSLVSAIALAYIRENSVPLVNIPAADLAIRKDALFVLEKFGIDPSVLLYEEEIPLLLEQAQLGKIRLTLVDHNELAYDQQKLLPFVSEIIDHHVDENVNYPELKSKKIQMIGSNTTLIAEEILKNHPDQMTPELASFLLAPILLDTGNLHDHLKTTPRDVETVNELKKVATEKDLDTYFAILLEKKNEVDLTRPDLILKKDFKTYHEGYLTYGISSLPHSVDWNIHNRDLWAKAVQSFLLSEKLNLWIGLMQYEHHSELIFYTPHPALREALISHFATSEQLNQLMVYQGFTEDDSMLFYRTKEKLARKVIQPLFNFEVSPFIQGATSDFYGSTTP